jgi:hypothetical protein
MLAEPKEVCKFINVSLRKIQKWRAMEEIINLTLYQLVLCMILNIDV